MHRLRVQVLGPLEVAVDGHPVRLTAGRLRSLLAVLAMSAGKPVSVDQLAAAVWGESLPGNVRRSLQTYAGRLRAALRGTRIVSRGSGFALPVDPDDVDALRFDRLLDEAARQPSAGSERARLDEALELWRGDPFEGVDSEWLRDNDGPRLEERYLSALERRIDLDLADGRHGHLAAELGELTARYPLRESLWVRLLSALGRSGRYAQALESYETIRGRIAVELGVDPSPELRQVHADLVAGRAPAVPHEVGPATRSVVTPRQLPANIDRFTGRRDALDTLDRLAADGLGRSSVFVITGTAGVGKTTLAVRWAHQVADRFPDGQIYVDLGGFGPAAEAADPAEILRELLDAFNVLPERIPSHVTLQTGLLRSLLADKRVLMLLDNARDADQVRPLLPGGAGCLTVVTSRNDLAGLIVADGARPVPLDMLSPADARQLLVTRLGADRVAKEPTAVEAIMRSCACLPLALAIVAARAALRPTLPLAVLADELRDSRDDLGALDTGDEGTSVRAVFSWSHRAITPEAARLFRLFGLHPAPEISVEAAASLGAHPLPHARVLLTQLHRTNLATECCTDRYRLHDLLRAYARELADRHHPETERHDAVRRLLDHYLHTAYLADRLLDPSHPTRDPITPSAPLDSVSIVDILDPGGALAWFTTERPALLAAFRLAEDHGLDTHVWQLAWALRTFLDRQGHWHDLATTQRCALEAAERLRNDAEVARAHRVLARALARLHHYTDARTHLTRAMGLYRTLDDPIGQANTQMNLGQLYEYEGNFVQALPHNRQALELFERCDHKVGQAITLNGVGWNYTKLGDHRTALAYCERALRLNLDLDHRFGQADTWDSLGHIHLHLGDHRQSVACYQHALDLFFELGTPAVATSKALQGIGDAYHLAGDTPAARSYFRQALEILEEVHDPDADQLRTRLHRLAVAGHDVSDGG